MVETNDPDTSDRVPDWLKKNKRFKALMETHGNAGRAAAELGIELYQAGQVPRAAETLLAAVTIAPLEALYWGNYGVVLNALGQREKAVAMFNKSLALDTDQFQVWLNLANTLVPLGLKDAAAEAFENAARDKNIAAEAFNSLGLLQMSEQRYALAAENFKKAIDVDGGNALLHANWGAASFQAGDVATAATAYVKAAEMAPEETGYNDNALFLAMLAGVANGKAESAIATYAKPLEDDAILISALRRGLAFFNAFNRPDAARALVKEWLDYYPDDPEAHYAKAIILGRKLTHAPHPYIVQHFDELAERYDDAFLANLQYQVPHQIQDVLTHHLDTGWKGDIVDVGCGRGVMAPVLKPFAKTLTGVDLSPRMIEFANKRGLYDKLIVDDFIPYLEAHADQCDLITAASVLLYIGNLQSVFAAANTALRSGGLFIFDIESSNEAKYELQANGHFSHAEVYIETLAKPYFEVIEFDQLNLRQEGGKPVRGAITLLQKK
jgi:predicted TPR repeat methyltransferase